MTNRRAHNFKDLSGQRFGKLIVLKYVGNNRYQQSLWECLCDCGSVVTVNRVGLKSGGTKSCGCIKSNMVREKYTIHGMASSANRHRLYKIWARMLQRCNNPKNKGYKDYGGRGITVCDEWQKFEPFMKWAFDNGYKDSLEIDRRDNNKGYSPENCRFVTRSQNMLNTRYNRLVTINGETKPATTWARIAEIKKSTFFARLGYGWEGEDLLRSPAIK